MSKQHVKTARNRPSSAVLLSLLTVACAQGQTQRYAEPGAELVSEERFEAPAVYPEAPRGDVVDDYHGVAVADPYRWLEDPDAERSRQWIAEQNELTSAYLAEIPARAEAHARLTEMWNYERFGMPQKCGERWVMSRNDGLQNQSVLYIHDSLEDAGRLLLDPNRLSADGTVALRDFEFSEDGKHMAYSLAEGGSDWNIIRVRDVESGRDLADEIRWVKFSGISWVKNGAGFFYSRYDAPEEGAQLQGVNYNHKLYYHTVGTDQSQDYLVYERPDQKEWGFGGAVTDDGRYLIIHVWHGSSPTNRVFYKDLTVNGSEVVELLPDADADYTIVGNDGPVFWFKTNLDAPRARLIAIDTREPARENWRELIAESSETLRGVSVVGQSFVCNYLKDAHTVVRVHDLTGGFVREVDLPGLGTAGGFGGKREDAETFYTFTSFTEPGTIFRYEIATGESTVLRKPEVAFDARQYVTEQVFYPSKDGTKIPMFLTYRDGIELDGNNPTLLYGYGGFNVSMTPGFSPARIAWLEMGGVYAVANIRGGGEYGEEWHQAGTVHNKQNVFDDFIAAAEWLIDTGYTRTEKLAINGGSNGGLLVGACITQRPELFGAALPAVGVLDMLRFHKFTIGWAWTSDYGCSDDASEFNTLYAYSPYHNVVEGMHYPPTMITTADHDDRVVPAHSFKFAAAMQHAQGGDAPILIRIDVRAGHGAGKPTTKRIDQAADELAFLARELDMPGGATPSDVGP